MSSKEGKSDVGTYAWTSPEVIKGEQAGMKADVYAFGIIIWEILSLKIPWDGWNLLALIDAVKSGKRPELEEGMDEELRKLMER